MPVKIGKKDGFQCKFGLTILMSKVSRCMLNKKKLHLIYFFLK